jgi:hypothetical protein
VNGGVATLEDELPGDFNDPDGKRALGYAIITRAARAVGDSLSQPHKPIGEAIGLALDRRIEYLDGVAGRGVGDRLSRWSCAAGTRSEFCRGPAASEIRSRCFLLQTIRAS